MNRTTLLTPAERGALRAAMDCMVQAQMIALLPEEALEIGRHRRVLSALYLRLTHHHDREAEAEVRLLQRAGVLLRIFAARLLGIERQGVESTARRLAALIEEEAALRRR